MRVKSAVLLLLALGCGLAASVATSRYLSRPKPLQDDSVGLVVAKSNIAVGTTLRAEMVELAPIPPKMIPRGAFAKLDDVVGRSLRHPLFAGEAVIEPKLAEKGAGGGLTTLIPQGLRAITVKVNEFSGVAGFIKPGNYVDVLANFRKGEIGATTSRVVLQRVKVLAVDQMYRNDEGQSNAVVVNAVTLLVTPPQAEALALAASQGTLQLAMRNDVDDSEGQTSGVTLAQLAGSDLGLRSQPQTEPTPAAAPKASGPSAGDQLLGLLGKLKAERKEPKATPAAPSKPNLYSVEIIRGSEVSQQTFPLDNPVGETPQDS